MLIILALFHFLFSIFGHFFFDPQIKLSLECALSIRVDVPVQLRLFYLSIQ